MSGGEIAATVIGSITLLILALAALFAWIQLRTIRRTSYADLLMHLTEAWNSEPFTKSRHLIYDVAPLGTDEEQQRSAIYERMKTAEENRQEEYFLLTRPLDFLEDLAFLVLSKYIPEQDVRRTFGAVAVAYYDLFATYINEMRRQPGNSEAYKELETLVNKVKEGRLPG